MKKKRPFAKTAKRKRFDRMAKKLDPYAFLHDPKENIQQLLDEAFLGLGDTKRLKVVNGLLGEDRNFDYAGNPLMEILHYMREPENFAYTCKFLLGVNILPFQLLILQQLWKHKFPMMIVSRGGSKSFLLAIYCYLRAIFHQGCKIVIIGAAFRQAKIVFEYMETIWQDAHILRSMYGLAASTTGPRHSNDRFVFRLGASEVIAVPLGMGDKIRGLRANYVICDEFACLDYNSLIETDRGLIRIGENDARNVLLYTGDNNLLYEKPTNYIITPLTDVYEIKLENGYIIRCSKNHKVKTQDTWKTPLELTTNDYIESDNKYIFPNEQVDIVDEKLAWLMGMLVSEGTVTNKHYINITTTDENLAKRISREYGFTIYTKEAYVDSRGWNCKKAYDVRLNDTKFREKLFELGLDYYKAYKKKIPWTILRSPRNVVMAFLRGLFEGDGSCFTFNGSKNCNKALGVAYYSVSETLCRDVHVLLDKLGYDGYINFRKSNISDKKQWFVRLNSKTAYDFAIQLNIDRFKDPLTNCTLPDEPKYYAYYRNKYRVRYKFLGKYIYKFFDTECDAKNYVEEFKRWPRFRKVKSVVVLPEKQILYDYSLPQTHSFYANGSRQHNSVSKEIFEVVIRGFGAVSSKPDVKVKEYAKIKKMRELGHTEIAKQLEEGMGFGNQVIISGTPDYTFNHFYEYWTKYKAFVECRGDYTKLRNTLGAEVPEKFNWRDYCIIRVPMDKLPAGFLDEAQIAQGKATMDSSVYMKEYMACFPRDSSGFFKRSLIESCVCKPTVLVGNSEISFHARTKGDPKFKYVIGVDPASEHDNFAIVVLELSDNPIFRKIVYCWTMNRSKLRDRLRRDSKETDVNFYAYCARKIRDLSYKFPTDHIAIDSQGGGVSILECLHDPTQIRSGEHKYWPYVRQGDNDVFWWEKPDKPTDGEVGTHNLHVINFASADFVREANHGLRFDFENHLTLFPTYDALTYVTENLEEKEKDGDNLEDCYLELEEMKNELASIIHTQTVSGRDQWSTPEIKIQGGKKGRLRKDRYSALLIANEVARVMTKEQIGQVHYKTVGGYVGNIDPKKSEGGPLYIGPAHITQNMKGVYGMGVSRYNK